MFAFLTADRRAEIAFGGTLLVVAAAGFLAFELFFRILMSPGKPFEWRLFRKALVVFDSNLGVERFRPNSKYEHVSINSLGFRGPELALPKPAGTVRLVFMGHSLVLGAELDEGDTIAGQVSDRLRRLAPQCRIDYMSLSGSWYTAKQFHLLTSNLPKTVQPDVYIMLASDIGSAVRAHVEGRFKGERELSSLHTFLVDVSVSYRRLFFGWRNMITKRLPGVLSNSGASSLSSEEYEFTLRAHLNEMHKLNRVIGEKPVFLYTGAGWAKNEEGVGQVHSLLPAVSVASRIDKSHARKYAFAESVARQAEEYGWNVNKRFTLNPLGREFFLYPPHYNSAGSRRAAEIISLDIVNELGRNRMSCFSKELK